MENVTALVKHQATPCRFAPKQPWHICVRRDGYPLPDGETCWYESHAQATANPQKCARCAGRYPDFTDSLGVQWHSGCAEQPTVDKPVSAFEAAARMAKATKLANVLVAHGADSQSAERLPHTARQIVADLADCRRPSELTWQVTVSLLQARQAFITKVGA